MLLRLVTPPAAEPVTLAEAKEHLRVEDSRDDAYITTLVIACRQYLEQVCWRGLLTQTWEAVFTGFVGEDRFQLPEFTGLPSITAESGWISWGDWQRFKPYLELPMGQLAASTPIVSFNYTDSSGNVVALAASNYDVDSVSAPGRIRLAYGKSWPTTLGRWDAVKVQYKVGWATAGEVPEVLRHAVKLHLSQMYEHRAPQITGRILSPVDMSYDALIAPYRLARL